MESESTRQAAEAALRELPSVLGAFVREDVNGHPREVHLLIRSGPNPRHLAYDVRELLEERLGVPVDQRVISIAQLAPGRQPGPLLSASRTPTDAVDRPVSGSAPGDDDPDDDGVIGRGARLVFDGIATDAVQSRVRVRVTLALDDTTFSGEAGGVDSPPARLRAAAGATLQAVHVSCAGRARFEVEHVSTVRGFEREYVVVSVLVSSAFLGRRPLALVGAQPVEMDLESAAAYATLKAVNRIAALVLRLDEVGVPRDPMRGRRG